MSGKSSLATVFTIIVSALIGIGSGIAYYQIERQAYTATKTDENSTVLQLVNAFVSVYGGHRADKKNLSLPVPATFRANALSAFNEARKGQPVTNVEMVGVPGLEIKNKAKDDNATSVITELAKRNETATWSEYVELSQGNTLRMVKPVMANKDGCVACHNEIQAGKKEWKLGEMMGAYVIDVQAQDSLVNS